MPDIKVIFMGDGILKEILQLEQKIEAALDQEQELAEGWLTKARRILDTDENLNQQKKQTELEQQTAETICTARRAVAQKLQSERQWTKNLAELSEDRLRELLKERLKPVLSWRDNDCPDD
jgi:hypothetical protein